MRSNPLLKAVDRLVGRAAFAALRTHDAARRLMGRHRRVDSGRQVRCIVAVKLCCLGDGILAGPALRALKARWPEARLVVVCTLRSAEAFDTLPFVDEIHVLPVTGIAGFGEVLRRGRRALPMLRAIRRARPDIAVDLDLYYKATPVIAYLSGAPARVGFDTAGYRRAGLFTVSVPRDPDRWEAESFLEVTAAVGAPSQDTTLEYHVPPEAVARVEELLREHAGDPGARLLALCPGSSKNWPAKQWPPEAFAQVARWAGAERGLLPVLLGAAFERELCERVARAAGVHSVNLAGETTVAQTAAALTRAEALVTNDTGPMHLACAVGTPVVALFGPTNERKWGPRGAQDVIIALDDCDCRPCEYLSEMPDCAHRRCLLEITPERVISALAAALDGRTAYPTLPGTGGTSP